MMMSHPITLAYLKGNTLCHLNVTEQKYTNIDDNPSVYTISMMLETKTIIYNENKQK